MNTSQEIAAVCSEYCDAADLFSRAVDSAERIEDATHRVIILNSLIVTHCSIIEEAFRNIVEAYLGEMRKGATLYSDLPDVVRAENVKCFLHLATKHARDGNSPELRRAVSSLSLCLANDESYQLAAKMLSHNQGNLKSKEVTAICKRVGVRGIWDTIVSCEELEMFTGDANAETRMNSVVDMWNSIFDERDVIAHRFSQASGWGANRIKNSIELSKIIISRVGAVLAGSLPVRS